MMDQQNQNSTVLNQMNKERNAFLDKFEPSISLRQSSKDDIAKILAKYDVHAVKKATNLTL